MSVNHTAIQKALRDHNLTLLVCEAVAVASDPLTLGATTNGYTRADGGSFIDDGFKKGMEVLGEDFTKTQNNGPRTITSVTDSLLSCPGCVAESAGTGKALSVGFPSRRARTNVRFQDRLIGNAYTDEAYMPGPTLQISNNEGEIEVQPMYVTRFWIPADTDIDAIGAYVDSLINHYLPLNGLPTIITTDDSVKVRSRLNVKPFASQCINMDGFATQSVSIPLFARINL